MSPALDEATLIRRATAVVAVILVGLFFGYQASRGYVLPIALLGGFFIVALLLTRPKAFLFLSIFVFYGALGIVDMESFGRVAGLFRLKDVFTVLIVGYPVVTGILQKRPRPTGIKRSLAYRPWVMLLLWLAFVFGYTVMVIGEKWILALRVGRTYLFYGLPFLVLWWLRNDKDWDELYIFLHGLGLATVLLAFLGGFGVNVQFFSRYDEVASVGSAAAFGLYRKGGPGESLVYALFILSFWRFVLKPTRGNGLLAATMAFGSSLFLFRARIAGTMLGMAVGWLFVSWRYRVRTVVVGLAGITLLLGVLVVWGAVAKAELGGFHENYLNRIVGFFGEGARGLIDRDTIAVTSRRMHVELRWPLVRQHPILGIGFISPFGSIAWDVWVKGGMPIGITDVGWIDLLIRLGFVGAFFIVLLLAAAGYDAFDVMRREKLDEREKALCLTLIGYVILMVATTYSFSYPTWEPSIVTFAILFSFVVHIRAKRQQPQPPEEGPLPSLRKV